MKNAGLHAFSIWELQFYTPKGFSSCSETWYSRLWCILVVALGLAGKTVQGVVSE